MKKVNANGQHVATVRGPSCTDNFQIIEFVFEGNVYFSAEQCFQSLKFAPNSSMRAKIQRARPTKEESDGGFGMRVWGMGQSRGSPLRDNYEDEKVKLMFLVNLAKYSCHDRLQQELVEETKHYELMGAPSTWHWAKWNGLIQMLIRKKIKQSKDLKLLFVHYKAMSNKQIAAELEGDGDEEEDQLDDAKEADDDNNGDDHNEDANDNADEAQADQEQENDKNENEDVAAPPVDNENQNENEAQDPNANDEK